MERELWPLLYRTVRAVAADFSDKYKQLPSWVLLLTLLWAALHDRPICWACQAEHWKMTSLNLHHVPSPATMSRRIDSVAVGWLWRAVEQRLRALSPAVPGLLTFLDGKPLPVGVVRKTKTPAMVALPGRWPKAINCTPFGPMARCRRRGK